MSAKKTAAAIEKIFHRHGVRLTLGAEPTCVPENPEGPEWSITATGPTKLVYARALATAFIRDSLPGGLAVFSPGKIYPGETNPRWALHLVARRDGHPILPAPKPRKKSTAATPDLFLRQLAKVLKLAPAAVLSIPDPVPGRGPAFILPLDGDGDQWASPEWIFSETPKLLFTEGPAGLRLPLHLLKSDGPRRAVIAQTVDDRLEIFLPPFLQTPWNALLQALAGVLPAGVDCDFAGHVPFDELGDWIQFTIASDPGVIEINMPPCATWREYDHWLRRLEKAQRAAGLRSFKMRPDGRAEGTGGGHHLLFGGPSLGENPFFTNPAWLVSILRHWQRHPSLSYLFTGCYVGSTSQAPRPDESGKSLWDLEMAYAWLENLPRGLDHRSAIAGTLIHLHSDAGGNTHRSETSFDKFWSPALPGGARGLVEFRALESLPRAEWASDLALLWLAIAAMLLKKSRRIPLRDFGDSLHDHYFLPSALRDDFEEVLSALTKAGLAVPSKNLRAIFDWRFPVMLETPDGLIVRSALESWPLLCETPLEGGNTTRFVDTSVDRLEFLADADFARLHRLRVNGRPIPLKPWKKGQRLTGLRYRRSALNPSLHPGIAVQLPLILEIESREKPRRFQLEAGSAVFKPCHQKNPPAPGEPCRTANPTHRCFDLRIP
ncbi:MAG: transglutaminase family protein [Verrucomicrobiota bacterium]